MLVIASIALAFAAQPSSYQPLTFFTAPCIGQGISLDFAGEDGRWTYHNLTVGLADIAPTMVAQRDEKAGTYYRLIKSSTMLEGYLHGYEKYVTHHHTPAHRCFIGTHRALGTAGTTIRISWLSPRRSMKAR